MNLATTKAAGFGAWHLLDSPKGASPFYRSSP